MLLPVYSGKIFKASAIVNYDSRVVLTSRLPILHSRALLTRKIAKITVTLET